MPQINVWDGGFCPIPVPLDLNENGEIDRDVIRAFTQGQCHAFALALHQATGWPLIGLCTVGDPDSEGGEPDDSPGHVVCYSPELDDYIDIRGGEALRRWEKRWGEQRAVFLTASQIPELSGYMAAETNVAVPFVKTLLQTLPAVNERHPHKRNVDNQVALC